jgi:hypothetical protein
VGCSELNEPGHTIAGGCTESGDILKICDSVSIVVGQKMLETFAVLPEDRG